MSNIKVRFAPSPTGPFHIGGARSALFNYLYAKKVGGTFLLRVEDTDLERSTRESEENIKNALKWLNLNWDEGIDVGGNNGPYRQSERLHIYQEVTDKLLAEGKAYRCFCDEDKLNAEREAQLAKGETPKYTGTCAHLDPAVEAKLLAENKPYTIRLRVPLDEVYAFEDMVRGHISFDSNGIGDFVIVKSDGMPVYNYGVVVDDHMMGVTHVIRAEEHISNTPRQLALFDALGWKRPIFAHISLILGSDRKKMSKRHGATSVDQYKNLGYLSEALVNFLALLGWSPTGEEEIFNHDELIQAFDMEHVAKNPAVFNIEKLNHINSVYIKKLDIEKLYELCLPHLQEAKFASANPDDAEKARLVLLCETLRDYISYGAQIKEEAALFFKKEIVIAEELQEQVKAILAEESFPIVMSEFATAIQNMEEFIPDNITLAIKALIKATKLKGKFVYMPIRIALTGQAHGPELPNVIALLGRETCLQRLKTAHLLLN